MNNAEKKTRQRKYMNLKNQHLYTKLNLENWFLFFSTKPNRILLKYFGAVYDKSKRIEKS